MAILKVTGKTWILVWWYDQRLDL